MCVGPEVALALGATGLGNYMQAKENNSSINAQYNARNAVQQRGYEEQARNAAEAQSELQPAIAGFSAPNQATDLGNLITSRANTINANSATPSTGNLPSAVSTAPKVVQDSLASRLGQAVAFNKQQGDALAKVGATNDQALNNAINVQNSGLKINTIDNFSRAQAGVNQAQAEAAYNNARKSPSPFWSLLSDAGTIAGLDAAGGGKGFSSIGSLIAGSPETASAGAFPWQTGSVTTGPGGATTGTGGLY